MNPAYERLIYFATVKNKYLIPSVHLYRDFSVHFSKSNFNQFKICITTRFNIMLRQKYEEKEASQKFWNS
jgi:hypothetical protein